MDLLRTFESNHTHFVLHPKRNLVVFYTPNVNSFRVLYFKKNESTEIQTSYPITNIHISSGFIVVYTFKFHEFFSTKTFKCNITVVREDIIFQFKPSRNKIFYLRSNDFLVYEQNMITSKKPYVKHFSIGENYLSLVRFSKDGSEPEFVIYKRNKGKVFSVLLKSFLNTDIDPTQILDISLHNKKIYLMIGDKIIGHDLNVYLDELPNYEVSKFKVIYNELILADKKHRKILLIEKNLKKILFECEGNDFFYDCLKSTLYVMFEDKFTIYKRRNEYKREFTLISQSYLYKEQEDEFDISDNSYRDI